MIKTMNTAADDVPGGNGGDDPRCATWSSTHRGGAHCVMGDGAVKFVIDTVSLPIQQAAATMSGGEQDVLD